MGERVVLGGSLFLWPTPDLKKLSLKQLRQEKTSLARQLFANGGSNGKTKSYVRRILLLNMKILRYVQQKP